MIDNWSCRSNIPGTAVTAVLSPFLVRRDKSCMLFSACTFSMPRSLVRRSRRVSRDGFSFQAVYFLFHPLFFGEPSLPPSYSLPAPSLPHTQRRNVCRVAAFVFRLAQISGACVISGLYCQGALVLANIGDCQAVYHGHVKSSPGTAVTAQTVSVCWFVLYNN